MGRRGAWAPLLPRPLPVLASIWRWRQAFDTPLVGSRGGAAGLFPHTVVPVT